VATYSTTTLAVGSDSITATYAGNSDFAASTSSPISITVNAPPGATTTTLTASSNNISAGSPVTFTATVAATSGTSTPTGNVAFNDGATTLSTVPLASGTATYTTTSLGQGSNSVTAAYSGGGSFSGSTSSAVVVTVRAAQSSSQFCATLDEPEFAPTQQTCALGSISLGQPENQNNFWGAVDAGICSTMGWPASALNGFSCTWPSTVTVTFSEPVQSIALVTGVTTNNGPELTACAQSGVGNILATSNSNPDATGTVTITQSTSSYSNSLVPALCSVVAFDANGEAIVIAVGLQLSGGGPN
jgi:hypothetical protein